MLPVLLLLSRRKDGGEVWASLLLAAPGVVKGDKMAARGEMVPPLFEASTNAVGDRTGEVRAEAPAAAAPAALLLSRLL
jgi:hypothetical protein